MGSKTISQEDIAPVLEKLKDHLISKNVAAEIAAQLCNSVAVKLDGKVFDHLHYLRLFCLLKKIFQSPFRNVRSLYRIPTFFFLNAFNSIRFFKELAEDYSTSFSSPVNGSNRDSLTCSFILWAFLYSPARSKLPRIKSFPLYFKADWYYYPSSFISLLEAGT